VFCYIRMSPSGYYNTCLVFGRIFMYVTVLSMDTSFLVISNVALTGLIATFIAVQYLLIQELSNYSEQFFNKMIAASYSMTIGVNVIVTALIVGRLLQHRASLKNCLAADTLSLYTGLMALVIESAVPICVFGILSSVTALVDSQTSFFFSTMWTIICVRDFLYPKHLKMILK
jgi:hypothetical protein